MATLKTKRRYRVKIFEAVAVQAVMWDAVQMSNMLCAGCKQTGLPYASDLV